MRVLCFVVGGREVMAVGLSIVQGGTARQPLEGGGKMMGVAEVKLVGDFRNGQKGIEKHHFGQGDLLFQHILIGRDLEFGFKKTDGVCLGAADALDDAVEVGFFGAVIHDVIDLAF